MVRWRAWRDRFLAGEPTDAGIGLVLVIGYAVVIGIVLTVSVASVSSVLGSGRSHVQFGQAVDSAEAGVDQTLARVSHNANFATAGVTVPFQWQDGFPDSATERAWVLSTVETAISTTPTLLQKSAQGEFAAVRPNNAQSIYSVGWEPTKSNASRIRVLRNDYLFSGYSPKNAIQSNGNVAISGSFTLASNAGTASPPSVHTEGQLTSCSNSLTKPDGTTIAAVGGGCGATEPSQTIPRVDPRGMYDQLSPTHASQWYDLCYLSGTPTVRAPALTPCTGTVVGSSRGWSFNASSRTWTASNPQAGIYYAYQANLDLTGAGETSNVTLIAESAANAGGCPQYGNVHIKQTQLTPALPFVSIYAGGSVTLESQSAAGSTNSPGLVGATQNITMSTSSAPGVVGAVVANNVCSGSNSFQGSQVTFDGNMTIRSADLIRSTLQTELN